MFAADVICNQSKALRDGSRFTCLIRALCEETSQASSIQNLDDATRWLSKVKLIDGTSLANFEGTSEQAFLVLLWSIACHFIVTPIFGSEHSDQNEKDGSTSGFSLEVLCAGAVRWAFSFAGPFVPRVLKPNLSIIHDGKLLAAIVNRGS